MRELELLHVFSSTSNDTSVTLRERENKEEGEKRIQSFASNSSFSWSTLNYYFTKETKWNDSE